uniref:SH2 domain-containing protein n=1 Tax=Sarcophilus harrisii TaxID=9305 RepID=A0A7N4NFU4_SARHA
GLKEIWGPPGLRGGGRDSRPCGEGGGPHPTQPEPPEHEEEGATRPKKQKAGLLTQPWYSAHCDRQTVENTLLLLRKDGSYTIRLSSDPQGLKPFTLAVFSHGHVYHIPIRWLEAQGQYALGRESRSSDKLFPTVASLVQHFSQHPLLLVNRCGGDRQHARLLFPTKA